MASPHGTGDSERFILREPLQDLQPGSLWIKGNDGLLHLHKGHTSTDWHAAFSALDQTEFDLLTAVRRNEDRLDIASDPEWLNEGKTLSLSDRVKVVNVEMLSGVTGTIRFKGPLKNGSSSGILFGIVLDERYSGMGFSDGHFRKRRYFSCGRDCGLFYSLKCIRKAKSEGTRSRDSESTCKLLSTEFSLRPRDVESSTGDFLSEEWSLWSREPQIGERVVWISDDGPKYGYIRWLGSLPDVNPELGNHAGVEFDNPIGKGNGRYKGKQLFIAKQNHASLVPLIGLLRESDYVNAQSRDTLLSTGSFASPTSTSDVVCRHPVCSEEAQLNKMTEAKIETGTFKIGDKVQVRLRSKPHFGTLRWLQRTDTGYVIAGLEMEEPDLDCFNSGEFEGQLKFRCPDHTAFFVFLHRCRHASVPDQTDP